MDVYRRWFCTCSSTRVELAYEAIAEGETDEPGEPTCPRCGATPSSDPRRTVSYEDVPLFKD
ncbi:MAG: hypothetical protein IH614_03580 [Desulfuromonadales bacterium]|nr:hypothetical protein [Desulfuromonadales bacterium]